MVKKTAGSDASGDGQNGEPLGAGRDAAGSDADSGDCGDFWGYIGRAASGRAESAGKLCFCWELRWEL